MIRPLSTPQTTKQSIRASGTLRRLLQLIQAPQLESDACLIQSFPKSGSTWLKFMLATVIAGETIGFDDSDELFPNLPGLAQSGSRSLKLGSPFGIYRTHDARRVPPRLFRCRVLVLVREPLATWSSYQRHLVANGRPTEDYDAFLEQAATGKLRDGYGSWQQNVSSWLGRGAPSRLLVVDYDDLNAHTVEVLTKICDFMSLKTSPERIDLAIHANSRQAMRHREAESKGLRVRATPFVSLTNDQSGNRYLSRDATSVSVREATELWKEIRRSRLD